MEIVTITAPGRHMSSWQLPVSGVAPYAGEQRDEQQQPRHRGSRLVLGNRPTPDPQRPSAPRRWST